VGWGGLLAYLICKDVFLFLHGECSLKGIVKEGYYFRDLAQVVIDLLLGSKLFRPLALVARHFVFVTSRLHR
jgi:hypothetical protein